MRFASLKRFPSTSRCGWLKRLGVLGFLFFLIKGLVWLSLPVVLFYWGN